MARNLADTCEKTERRKRPGTRDLILDVSILGGLGGMLIWFFYKIVTFWGDK